MNIMSIAVASIVDANTGNGINQKFVDKFASDYAVHDDRNGEIRANVFITLLGKLKSAVKAYIDQSIVAAREREDIRVISSMSEYLLKDIGLIQIDVDDLRSGLISLNSLSARREKNLRKVSTALVRPSRSNVEELNGINQESSELKKCA
ncbi:MAG: hypothetical protein OEY09_13245 [Gammaproteobacteria bacterium]|nr:hypothetical protein [Gammaproteobacteria bacterium]